MFAKLVQNATEVKNLPDNLIKSRIDEENHSLLHYLVVWRKFSNFQKRSDCNLLSGLVLTQTYGKLELEFFLSFYYYHWVDISAGGLLVHECNFIKTIR
jgi:hypothetical protein